MEFELNKPLYKIDSKGKTRVWLINVGSKNQTPFYSVSHGQLDGKLQETEVSVPVGKSIGRANETTAEQQCLLEAEALYVKQIDRKGYSETITTERPNLPMLAHKYKDYSHKIIWPAIGSIKINGIRLLISIKNGVLKTTSRAGDEMFGLSHITNELLALKKDIVLDGELFNKKYTLQQISSIVRKKKSLDPRMIEIKFNVFDIINDKTYHQRIIEADNFITGLKNSVIVPWKIIETEAKLMEWHKTLVSDGYEGTMIRNIDAKYELNKRSYNILKIKDFEDKEFKIVGWKTGKGKFEFVPTFELINDKGNTFEATPEGCSEDRLNYLKNADSYIGKMGTVRFFGYTDKGVPNIGIFVAVRDYE